MSKCGLPFSCQTDTVWVAPVCPERLQDCSRESEPHTGGSAFTAGSVDWVRFKFLGLAGFSREAVSWLGEKDRAQPAAAQRGQHPPVRLPPPAPPIRSVATAFSSFIFEHKVYAASKQQVNCELRHNASYLRLYKNIKP